MKTKESSTQISLWNYNTIALSKYKELKRIAFSHRYANSKLTLNKYSRSDYEKNGQRTGIQSKITGKNSMQTVMLNESEVKGNSSVTF